LARGISIGFLAELAAELLLVETSVVKKLNIEAHGKYEVSSAEVIRL
jgi:hypothetical protein